VKLRIRGDSVRLRLVRSELQSLLDQGAVEEATRFPGGSALRYRLLADPAAKAVTARFEAGQLSITLPRAAAKAWGESEEEGLEAELPLEGGTLRVLIEKDFPCLATRPHEDDRDAFPRKTPSKDC
jgi:hypothetical protein